MTWKATLATVIPLAIMTAIGIALLAQGDTEAGRGTLCVGVIAAAVSGSSFIYQVERWSLLRQSLMHIGIMLVTVFPALLLTGWYDLSTAGGWWAAIGTYAAWGIGIWSVMYVITSLLEKRRRRGGDHSPGDQVPAAG